MYVWNLEQGFGLATQEPWIQFCTVRENILFGKEYNARHYQEVLEACALSDDLNVSALEQEGPPARTGPALDLSLSLCQSRTAQKKSSSHFAFPLPLPLS